MFREPAVSMRELELESAELLPRRETLCVTRWHGGHSGYGQSYGHHRTVLSLFSQYRATAVCIRR